MKSTIKTLLCLLLAACMLLALAACEAQKAEEPTAEETPAEEAPAQETEAAEAAPAGDASEFKTMGDVLAYDSVNRGSSDTLYVYVFEKDGVFWRATAEISADISEALWDLDFFADDYDEQVDALIAPLPIMNLENLSELIPSQEELDALVGKTGQELKDDGWTIWSWQLDDLEFGMYYGPFSYTVVMEGDYVPNENYDFDEDADFAPLTVKSVAFDGIGDATGDVLDAGMDESFDVIWLDEGSGEASSGEATDEGQNPLMNCVGEYQSGRAHAVLEAFGVDGFTLTIEWGDSAMSLAKWEIESFVDEETMTSSYICEKTYVTYNENGEVESEEVLSADDTGTIVFNEDGTFTWHDDQSAYDEDMVFERVPEAE